MRSGYGGRFFIGDGKSARAHEMRSCRRFGSHRARQGPHVKKGGHAGRLLQKTGGKKTHLQPIAQLQAERERSRHAFFIASLDRSPPFSVSPCL